MDLCGGRQPAELYLRLVSFGFGIFVLLNAIPIAAKWLLIGSWKQEVFPVWSLRYFRFWVVKTLVRSAPMAALAGTPLYNLYLRLLGAKIGRNTVISSRFVPVCTDLFSVGDNTILQQGLDPARLQGAVELHLHRLDPIGDNAYVGEASVLDIDTAMGNDTQLGHASSLQSGQRVPDGKHYHGSPAQETHGRLLPGRGHALHVAAACALFRHLSWSSASLSSRRSRSCCSITGSRCLLRYYQRRAARPRGADRR